MERVAWGWLLLLALLLIVAWQPLGTGQLGDFRYYRFGFVELAARALLLVTLAGGAWYYRQRGWPGQLNATLRLAAVLLLTWELAGNLDVAWTSVQANRLCREEGGLHVYRTATTDGFLSSIESIENASKRGFRFVEFIKHRGNEVTITRGVMVGGQPRYEVVDDYASRYEAGMSLKQSVMRNVEKGRAYVRDRVNGELLGELVRFTIHPGTFDMFVLGFLPRGRHAEWYCGEEASAGEGSYQDEYGQWFYSSRDVIERTLKSADGERDDS